MVVVVGHEASLTGAPKSLLKLCKELQIQHNYSFFFLFKNGGELIEEFNKIGECLIYNESYNSNLLHRLKRKIVGDSRTRALRRIEKMSKMNQLSHIYFNTIAHQSEIINFFVSLDVPIITHVRELNSVIKYYSQFSEIALLLEESRKIISVSQCVKSFLTSEYQISPEKVLVVSNAVEFNFTSGITKNKILTHQEVGIPPDSIVIMGCGTQIYRKGTDLFIQVANYIVNKLKLRHIHFMWIGGDSTSLFSIELREEIEKLDLSKNVKLIPATQNVVNYMNASDVFILTSREEPFGRVLLETALIPIPVVAFKNAGFADQYIEDGVNGFLVNYMDIIEMANKIELLSNKLDLRMNLAKNNRERVRKYDVDNMVKLIHNLFLDLSR